MSRRIWLLLGLLTLLAACGAPTLSSEPIRLTVTGATAPKAYTATIYGCPEAAALLAAQRERE